MNPWKSMALRAACLTGLVACAGAQQNCNDGIRSVQANSIVQGKIRCDANLVRGPGPVLGFCPQRIVFEPAYDMRIKDQGSGKRAKLVEFRPIVAVDYTCRRHFFLFIPYSIRCEPKATSIVGLVEHVTLQGC